MIDAAPCCLHPLQAQVDAARRPKLSGDFIEEAIPDPIPNSEVKLFRADGTAWGICVGE